MEQKVIAEIKASPLRRYVSVGVMFLAGALLVYAGTVGAEGSLLWKVTLVGLGIVILLFAERFRVSTSLSVFLTEAGLHDSTGRVLCGLDDILTLDKSAFSLKPNDGFLIKLKSPPGRAYVPGMWWRFGRFLGVGGVTQKNHTKFVADYLALMVAEHQKLDQQ